MPDASSLVPCLEPLLSPTSTSCADPYWPCFCLCPPVRLDTEAYLTSHALPPLQALLNTLFSLPTQRTSSGPLATLPPPTTMLPREKPLPKPKPLTKWERFANAKGISHSKKDKKVWDDDRQEFVARWGRDGLNKKVEEQWITEVKVRPGACPSSSIFLSLLANAQTD